MDDGGGDDRTNKTQVNEAIKSSVSSLVPYEDDDDECAELYGNLDTQVNEATKALNDKEHTADEIQKDDEICELLYSDLGNDVQVNDAITVASKAVKAGLADEENVAEDETEGKTVATEAVKAGGADEGNAAEEIQYMDDDEYDELYGDLGIGGNFVTSLNTCNYAHVSINVEDETTKTEAKKLDKEMSGGGEAPSFHTIFIKDLEWWTTDADLEKELCKYGVVKDVKFFIEESNAQSMGYCEVEFSDERSVVACQQGMNGHVFNGKPCVVEIGSYEYESVKKMYLARLKKNVKKKSDDPSQKPAGSNLSDADNNGNGRSNLGEGTSGGILTEGVNARPQGMMAQGINPVVNRPTSRFMPQGMMARGINPTIMPRFRPDAGIGRRPSFAPYGNETFRPGFPPLTGIRRPSVAPYGNETFRPGFPPFAGIRRPSVAPYGNETFMPGIPPTGIRRPSVAPYDNMSYTRPGLGIGMPWGNSSYYGWGMMPMNVSWRPNMGMELDPNANNAVLGAEDQPRNYGEGAASGQNGGGSRQEGVEKTREKERGSAERDLSGSKHGKQHREENRYIDRSRDIERELEQDRQGHRAREGGRGRWREHSRNDREKYDDDHFRGRYKSPKDNDERKRRRSCSTSRSKSRHRDDQHSRSHDSRNDRDEYDDDHSRRRYRSPEYKDERKSSYTSHSKSRYRDDQHSRSRYSRH